MYQKLVRNTFIVTVLFWLLVSLFTNKQIMTNTSLIFFLDPNIPRWIGDTLSLTILLPLIVWWLNEDESRDFDKYFSEIIFGFVVAVLAHIFWGSTWALILGIAGIMVANFLYSWKEYKDRNPMYLIMGPSTWPGYVPGLLLGIGLFDGFAVSLFLFFPFVVLPLIVLVVVCIVLLSPVIDKRDPTWP